MSNPSIPILPLWLHRWPAMRTIVVWAFFAVIVLELLFAVVLWSWPEMPYEYRKGMRLASS